MESVDLYSMLMLGLLGTGHCIGMCGPLVFSFPGQSRQLNSHLVYHGGRIITYTIFGVLMGAVGTGLVSLAYKMNTEPAQLISIIRIGLRFLAALFLLLFGIARLGVFKEPEWMGAAGPSKIPGFKKIMEVAGTSQTPKTYFVLGIFNGLLPCGLSYGAFANALASSGPFMGGALTLAFGIGTLPGLFVIGYGAYGIAQKFRKPSDIISGLLMIGMAVRIFIKIYRTIA